MPLLEAYLGQAQRRHEEDLSLGNGSVEMPFALSRKCTRAAWQWGRWVFRRHVSTESVNPVFTGGTITIFRFCGEP